MSKSVISYFVKTEYNVHTLFFFLMQEGRTGLESLRNVWRTEKKYK